MFYRSGERVAEGLYKVDDDVFIETREEGRGKGEDVIAWHGRSYRVPMPPGARPPLFLALDGLLTPPAGDVVVVVPRRPSLLDLWRRRRSVTHHVVVVEPINA